MKKAANSNPKLVKPHRYTRFMIQELIERHHYSFSRIAKRCQVTNTTIINLWKGITLEPRYPVFRRLLILYHRVCYPIKAQSYYQQQKNHD